MTKLAHENIARDETVIVGSDRSFGLVMTAAFAVISLLYWWQGVNTWRWTGGIALFFLVAALLYPAALQTLNGAWQKFGLLLQKIVNPIVIAVVFLGTVLPTGLIMRLLGRDLLRLKRQPDADSYWIKRRPAGPAAQSMKDQF